MIKEREKFTTTDKLVITGQTLEIRCFRCGMIGLKAHMYKRHYGATQEYYVCLSCLTEGRLVRRGGLSY